MTFSSDNDDDLLDLNSFLQKHAPKGITKKGDAAAKQPELFRETARPQGATQAPKKAPKTVKKDIKKSQKNIKSQKSKEKSRVVPPPHLFEEEAEEGEEEEDEDQNDEEDKLAVLSISLTALKEVGHNRVVTRHKKSITYSEISDSDYSSDNYDFDDSFIDDRSFSELQNTPPPKTLKTPSPKTPGTRLKRLVRGTDRKPRVQPEIINIDSDSDSNVQKTPPRELRFLSDSEDESKMLASPSKNVKTESESDDEVSRLPLGNLKLSAEADSEKVEDQVPSIPGAFVEDISGECATGKEMAAPPRGLTPPLKVPVVIGSLGNVKKLPVIPPTPYDEGDDDFWDEVAVNDWNDLHSPQKQPFDILRTAKPLDKQPLTNLNEKFKKVATLTDSEEGSAMPDITPKTTSKKATKTPKTIDPEKEKKKQRKEFLLIRDQFAKDFLKELDEKVTGGRVGAFYAATGGIELIWNKTLRTTAGQAKQRFKHLKRADKTIVSGSEKYYGIIELSDRILDEKQKVLDTLTHEFCHLAVMSLDKVLKGRPHGAEFQRWGARASQAFRHLGIEVTTTHDYQLNHKFRWDCTNANCDQSYSRNSKSIDPNKVLCNRCHSKIVQTMPKPRQGAPNAYQVYLKANMDRIKAANPGVSGKEIIKLVAADYQKSKQTQAQLETDTNDIQELMGGLKV